jgi:OTU domain-containing protein 3
MGVVIKGTYGGHLELSAFAHLSQRNVKVIQPGLVYVIEWAAGAPPTTPTAVDRPPANEDIGLDEREKRRLRRDQKRAEKLKVQETDDDHEDHEENDDDDPAVGAVYVAYVLSPPTSTLTNTGLG